MSVSNHVRTCLPARGRVLIQASASMGSRIPSATRQGPRRFSPIILGRPSAREVLDVTDQNRAAPGLIDPMRISSNM